MSILASTWAWSWQRFCHPTGGKILLALADYADDDGICWPSQKSLAAKCGIQPRTVQRRVKDLEKLGLVTIEPRTTSEGRTTSNLYHLALGRTAPLGKNSKQGKKPALMGTITCPPHKTGGGTGDVGTTTRVSPLKSSLDPSIKNHHDDGFVLHQKIVEALARKFEHGEEIKNLGGYLGRALHRHVPEAEILKYKAATAELVETDQHTASSKILAREAALERRDQEAVASILRGQYT